MGQRNMIYTGPILETEPGHIHPEPSYGGMPNFPQPTNNRTIPPPSGNRTGFNPQHLPENGPLPHGITQFNGMDHHQHHHPVNNVFMTPTGAQVFPGAISHGIRVGFENGQFIDVFKRKNAEGFPGNIQYLVPGNYGGQPLQAVPNPWLDQQFCMPYLQGPINGGGLDGANVGLHGYQGTTSNRIPGTFVQPPANVPHHMHHQQPPPMQVASTSRRLPTNTIVNPNPFQNGRFVVPAQPTGVRLFQPHRRELMVEASARHRLFPHLRVLPEDGVAILDISGYHEAGHSVDHHRDMRLDIDHMSYEELLALGEQIGSAGSGLSNEFILEYLKTRKFAISKSSSDADQEVNSCVICQTDYDDQEQIGMLDCGHEYHVECVKKWLTVKNTCPVCKSTALAAKAKEL